MRAELRGHTTTTLTYKNLGLKIATMEGMTRGFNRWANGKMDCESLDGADPQWAPAQTETVRRR